MALPAIESAGHLAARLSLSPAELEWFADLAGLCGKIDLPKLQYYRYRIRTKRSGGVRLIEGPKRRLKVLQRRILSSILDPSPSIPPPTHSSKDVPSSPSPLRTLAVTSRCASFWKISSPPFPRSARRPCFSFALKNRPLEIDPTSWQETPILYIADDRRPGLGGGCWSAPGRRQFVL